MKEMSKHVNHTSKWDHIKELTSIYQPEKNKKITSNQMNYKCDEEWIKEMKEKDYSHHFKRDNFKVYTEAMVKQGHLMRR